MDPSIRKTTPTLNSIRWDASLGSLTLSDGRQTNDPNAIAAWLMDQTETFFRHVSSLSPEDRSDNASEAWVRVSRHMEHGDAAYLGGLVNSVCARTLIDFWRREGRRRHENVDGAALASSADESQDALLDKAVSSAFLAAARCLTAFDRRTEAEYVYLRFGEGLAYREIAEMYKSSEGAVRAATKRALVLLRNDPTFREQVMDRL